MPGEYAGIDVRGDLVVVTYAGTHSGDPTADKTVLYATAIQLP